MDSRGSDQILRKMTPGSVFVMASIPPNTLFRPDQPAREHRIFGLFEPIPMDMVPVRDREHLNNLIRWDIYVHGHGIGARYTALIQKDVVRKSWFGSSMSVEVIDVQRLAFLLGMVKVFDLKQ